MNLSFLEEEMSCKFQDFNGKCQLFDGLIEIPGVDEEGNCICSDDEDPSYLCEEYEER